MQVKNSKIISYTSSKNASFYQKKSEYLSSIMHKRNIISVSDTHITYVNVSRIPALSCKTDTSVIHISYSRLHDIYYVFVKSLNYSKNKEIIAIYKQFLRIRGSGEQFSDLFQIPSSK